MTMIVSTNLSGGQRLKGMEFMEMFAKAFREFAPFLEGTIQNCG